MREVARQVGNAAERPVGLVIGVRGMGQHQVVHLVRAEIEYATLVFLVQPQ